MWPSPWPCWVQAVNAYGINWEGRKKSSPGTRCHTSTHSPWTEILGACQLSQMKHLLPQCHWQLQGKFPQQQQAESSGRQFQPRKGKKDIEKRESKTEAPSPPWRIQTPTIPWLQWVLPEHQSATRDSRGSIERAGLVTAASLPKAAERQGWVVGFLRPQCLAFPSSCGHNAIS